MTDRGRPLHLARTCLWLVALGLFGCSAALDFDGDCLTDEGCASLGENLACVEGRCVSAQVVDPPLPAEIFSAECDRLLGAPSVSALRAQDAVLIGALIPRSGSLAASAPAIEAALETAVADINGVGGINGTKLAILACDEGDDDGVGGTRAARHLIDTLHLDAVIGGTSSDRVVPIFQDAVRPRAGLLLAPAAPSPALANLPDDGLLWRVGTPSDISARAAAALMIAAGPERLMLVFDNDAWGSSAAALFNDAYCVGDPPRCAADRFTGLSLTRGAPDLAALSGAVADFAPDRVVLLVNGDELEATFATLAEAGITEVASIDAARAPSVLSGLLEPGAGGDRDARLALACRHVGLTSGGAGPQAEAWRFDFAAKHPDLEPDALTAVFADSVYLLGYAIAAARSVGPRALSGPRLAEGLKRLSGGRGVRVGAADWAFGISVLESSASATINYLGASGDLQFDPRTGDAAGPSVGWRYNVSRMRTEDAGVVLAPTGPLAPLNDALVSDDCACAPWRESARCCGDGTRQIGEACDDGNVSDGDGCSATCERE